MSSRRGEHVEPMSPFALASQSKPKWNIGRPRSARSTRQSANTGTTASERRGRRQARIAERAAKRTIQTGVAPGRSGHAGVAEHEQRQDRHRRAKYRRRQRDPQVTDVCAKRDKRRQAARRTRRGIGRKSVERRAPWRESRLVVRATRARVVAVRRCERLLYSPGHDPRRRRPAVLAPRVLVVRVGELPDVLPSFSV